MLEPPAGPPRAPLVVLGTANATCYNLGLQPTQLTNGSLRAEWGVACDFQCPAGGALWGAPTLVCSGHWYPSTLSGPGAVGGVGVPREAVPAPWKPICVGVPVKLSTALPAMATCGEWLGLTIPPVAAVSDSIVESLDLLNSSAWAHTVAGAIQLAGLRAVASSGIGHYEIGGGGSCGRECATSFTPLVPVSSSGADGFPGASTRALVSIVDLAAALSASCVPVGIDGFSENATLSVSILPVALAGALLDDGAGLLQTMTVASLHQTCASGSVAIMRAARSADWTLVQNMTSACSFAIAAVVPAQSWPPLLEVPAAADGTPLVSDALPPPMIHVTLPTAPAPGETITVTSCITSVPGLLSVVAETDVALASTNYAVGVTFDILSPYQRDGGASALAAAAPALFGEAMPRVRISCSLVSTFMGGPGLPAYPSRFTATVDVIYRRTVWPLLANVLVHYTEDFHVWALDPTIAGAPGTLELAARYPNAVITPKSGGNFEIPVSGATNITLVGDVLAWFGSGTALASPPSLPGFAVTLGDVGVAVTGIGSGGLFVYATLPSFEATCNNTAEALSTAGVSCPVHRLVLSTGVVTIACPPFCPSYPIAIEPSVRWAANAAEILAVMNGNRRRATDTTSMVTFPSAHDMNINRDLSSNAAQPPALESLVIVLAAPVDPSASARDDALVVALNNAGAAGWGVAYLEPCQGDYVSPIGTVCTDASNPNSTLCAWGLGDGCSLCPVGALCPGGYHARPRPGYYGVSESSPDIKRCNEPANVRCVGWDAVIGATKCGTGYDPAVPGCGACITPGFYADFSGACQPCPDNPGLAAFLRLVAAMCAVLGGCAAVAAITYASLWRCGAGGAKLAFSLQKLADFIVWLVVLVQTQAQVGRAASPGLPPLLIAWYSALSIALGLNIVESPSCYPGGETAALLAAKVEMSIALFFGACFIVFATLEVCRSPANDDRSDKASRRAALTCGSCHAGMRSRFAKFCDVLTTYAHPAYVITICATLLYPALSTAALSIVNVLATITVATYRQLGNDGAALLALGIPVTPTEDVAMLYAVGDNYATRKLQVPLMIANPYIVCYEGAHTPVAAMAWVALIAYSALLPVALYLLISRGLDRMQRARGIDVVAERAAAKARRVAYVAKGRSVGARILRLFAAMLCGASRSFALSNTVVEDDGPPVTAAPNVQKPPPVYFFIAIEYMPSHFHFQIVDMALATALTVLLVTLNAPATVAIAVWKFAGTVGAVAIAASLHIADPPYHDLTTDAGQRWKYMNKLVNYALLVVIASANLALSLLQIATTAAEGHVTTSAGVFIGTPPYDPRALTLNRQALATAATTLSYACLIVSALLFMSIAVGFGFILVEFPEDTRRRRAWGSFKLPTRRRPLGPRRDNPTTSATVSRNTMGNTTFTIVANDQLEHAGA